MRPFDKAQEIGCALQSDELRRAEVDQIDSFLWAQGESDDVSATMVKEPRLTTLADYKCEFHRMVRLISGLPWWSLKQTKLIAAELVQGGWLSSRNDFYTEPAHWPHECLMGVASSEGLGDTLDDREAQACAGRAGRAG